MIQEPLFGVDVISNYCTILQNIAGCQHLALYHTCHMINTVKPLVRFGQQNNFVKVRKKILICVQIIMYKCKGISVPL